MRLDDLLPAGGRRLIRMPYLFVFGRKDSTVSVMGANIYPQDIEAAIYADEAIARQVLSYQLSILEARPGETRPKVAIQLLEGEPTDELRDSIAVQLTERVRGMNRDYREAFGEYPALMPFVVVLHPRGEGPFAGSDKRIKFRYLARD